MLSPMSALTGFGSRGLRGVIARDFALLTPLGVENLDRVKCFYDKAWLIFRGETRGLLQPRCVCSSRPAFHAVE
jgi:hypothetical protein